MNPNINPDANNVTYNDPTPPPAPKKKKMTPLKWVAIFVPIGIVILALVGFLMINGLIKFVTNVLDQVAETEQYQMAFDYLTESDIFRQIETEDTTLTLTGYNSTFSGRTKEYEFTFETKKARYIIIVRDDGNRLYVSENECQYQQFFGDAYHLTRVCV